MSGMYKVNNTPTVGSGGFAFVDPPPTYAKVQSEFENLISTTGNMFSYIVSEQEDFGGLDTYSSQVVTKAKPNEESLYVVHGFSPFPRLAREDLVPPTEQPPLNKLNDSIYKFAKDVENAFPGEVQLDAVKWRVWTPLDMTEELTGVLSAIFDGEKKQKKIALKRLLTGDKPAEPNSVVERWISTTHIKRPGGTRWHTDGSHSLRYAMTFSVDEESFLPTVFGCENSRVIPGRDKAVIFDALTCNHAEPLYDYQKPRLFVLFEFLPRQVDENKRRRTSTQKRRSYRASTKKRKTRTRRTNKRRTRKSRDSR